MKRKLIVPILLILLAFPAFLSAQSAKKGFGFNRDEPYERLHNEISLRNLLGGLVLTTEQSGQLLEMAKKAEKIIEKMNKNTKEAKARAL